MQDAITTAKLKLEKMLNSDEIIANMHTDEEKKKFKSQAVTENREIGKPLLKNELWECVKKHF